MLCGYKKPAGCHFPPLENPELLALIIATNENDLDNGLFGWVCRRCRKGKSKAQPPTEPAVKTKPLLPPAPPQSKVIPTRRKYSEDPDVIILPNAVSTVPERRSKQSSSRDIPPRQTAEIHTKRRHLEHSEVGGQEKTSLSTLPAVPSVRDASTSVVAPSSAGQSAPPYAKNLPTHGISGSAGASGDSGKSSRNPSTARSQNPTKQASSTLLEPRVPSDRRTTTTQKLSTSAASAGQPASTQLPVDRKPFADIPTPHNDLSHAVASLRLSPKPPEPLPCLSIDLTEQRRKAKNKGVGTATATDVSSTIDGPQRLVKEAPNDHLLITSIAGIPSSSSPKRSLPPPIVIERTITAETLLPTPTSLAPPAGRDSFQNADDTNAQVPQTLSSWEMYKPEFFKQLDRQNPALQEMWTRVVERSKTGTTGSRSRKPVAKKLTKKAKKRLQDFTFIFPDDWLPEKKNSSISGACCTVTWTFSS